MTFWARLASRFLGVGSPTKIKVRKVKAADEHQQAAWLGHQSSILTGSVSEGPGAAGWEVSHTALSSPRITFSHWLRLFLGDKMGDSDC